MTIYMIIGNERRIEYIIYNIYINNRLIGVK